MTAFDLFSKRQKRLNGEMPDIFTYDLISIKLKTQIVHIIRDAIGEDRFNYEYSGKALQFVHETLCREFGVFQLKKYADSLFGEIYEYFLETNDIEQILDIIDLSFKVINVFTRESEYISYTKRKLDADAAIEELNMRFKDEGFGYQFESNELIKIDSTFIHSEITKPTLNFLTDKYYSGTNDEFLNAHEHYRHGRNKECLNECLKSFESVMKTICKKNNWDYNQNDTSKNLIDICLKNNLIPSYLQNQFTSLRSVLESGIPTIRNRLGGHGQGDKTTTVDDYLTNYALNLTASNIMFLIQAEKNLT